MIDQLLTLTTSSHLFASIILIGPIHHENEADELAHVTMNSIVDIKIGR